jgi:hypothetical protein
VTAKPHTEGAPSAGSETRPTDLSHIRVGPPFDSKLDRPCGCGCGKTTGGKTAAIVENTRSKKKRAYLEACVQERPDLLARRDTADEGSFLAA